MLFLQAVRYKYEKDSQWEDGWIIGEGEGNASTLLNSKFQPVPKVDNKFMCWDFKPHFEKNITISF